MSTDELNILKNIPGVQYVTRDCYEDIVSLWWGKPCQSECGVFANICGYDVGTLPARLFPSISPGDCICVEEENKCG